MWSPTLFFMLSVGLVQGLALPVQTIDDVPTRSPVPVQCDGLVCISEKYLVYDAATGLCTCEWIPGFGKRVAIDVEEREAIPVTKVVPLAAPTTTTSAPAQVTTWDCFTMCPDGQYQQYNVVTGECECPPLISTIVFTPTHTPLQFTSTTSNPPSLTRSLIFSCSATCTGGVTATWNTASKDCACADGETFPIRMRAVATTTTTPITTYTVPTTTAQPTIDCFSQCADGSFSVWNPVLYHCECPDGSVGTLPGGGFPTTTTPSVTVSYITTTLVGECFIPSSHICTQTFTIVAPTTTEILTITTSTITPVTLSVTSECFDPSSIACSPITTTLPLISNAFPITTSITPSSLPTLTTTTTPIIDCFSMCAGNVFAHWNATSHQCECPDGSTGTLILITPTTTAPPTTTLITTVSPPTTTTMVVDCWSVCEDGTFSKWDPVKWSCVCDDGSVPSMPGSFPASTTSSV